MGIEVTYDLREVLDGIRKDVAAGFAELRTAIAAKADKADLAAVHVELSQHHREIEQLKEAHQADVVTRQAVEAHEGRFFTRRGKVWASLGVIGVILATLLGPLLNHLATGH